jgi:glycosyltransferase involved in cell wall biosynthesis
MSVPEEGRPHDAAVPLRVLIVGHGPPTTGGIPTFVTKLVDNRWLRVTARRVEYLNTHPPGIKKPGAFNLANVRLTLGHAFSVYRRGRNADVVHLNLAATPSLVLFRSLVLSAAAKAAGSGVVLHAHTGQIEVCLRARPYRLLLRLVLASVDAFVVVSRSEETAVRALGTGRVYRVSNGVEIPPSTDGQRDGGRLVFVGTVCERKGLIDLRDALRLLRERGGTEPLQLGVTIVGDGEQEGPGAFESVKKAYAQAGLSDVEFCGALRQGEVIAALERAGIFCLPSHTEGFPISVLEAMACGNAIVATSVGDVPEMLEQGRAGVLVPPGDIPALAAAISRLLEDPGERARLSASARSRAERVYAQDEMVRKLYRIYAEASARARNRRRVS